MSEHEDQYWDKIDDFLDGQLTTEERTAFEAQLAEKEQLRKDLAFQQQMRQGIAFGSQDPLRARLGRIQAEYQAGEESSAEDKVVPIGGGLWNRWLAAAGLLIGALTILFLIQQPASSTELYASNYEPYLIKTTTRGPGQEDIADLAIRAYQTGDYASAIPRLEAAIKAQPEQVMLQLILAISQWENGEQEAAQETLLPLLDHPLFQDQAHWYAALFDLASDQLPAAQVHLEQVISFGGQLGDRAEELLESTNKINLK